MARKSRELRLSQTEALIEEYEEKNLQADYRYRFLLDVRNRILRRKSLTTRQRSWLDSLIEEGVPEIKRDEKLISEIKEALQLRGMEHRSQPLTDFMNRLSCGKELSTKQFAFLKGMLEEANVVRVEGPYTPSEYDKALLVQCLMLSHGYSMGYWNTHPGTARALRNVRDWIEGESEFVDEWSVNKITKAMASKLRELNDLPYASSGDLVWVLRDAEMITGVVSGDPEICEKGEITYPVLAGSEVLMLSKAYLSKRKTR